MRQPSRFKRHAHAWFVSFERLLYSKIGAVLNPRGIYIVATAAVSAIYKLGWAFIAALVIIVTLRGIFSETISIEPLSVPKDFVESGYTPDVASQRLRDSLNKYFKSTGSAMQGPSLTMTTELPQITIPKAEISIDAAAGLVRRLLHIGNAKVISGELIQRTNQIFLRLRINGDEIFTGHANIELSALESLFDQAAPTIMASIQPYLAASALYKTSPEKALVAAESIVLRYQPSDPNVEWSYVLEGKYYLDRGNPSAAEAQLRKAIRINANNGAAHYNLGVALKAQGRTEEAIVEYYKAIAIDSGNAAAHDNLALAFEEAGRITEAISEHKLAIAWYPSFAAAHNNLGAALMKQGDVQGAIDEYKTAIDIDPNYSLAHVNLALALQHQKDLEGAIVEFRRALESNQNLVPAHIGLAGIFSGLNRADEARQEYNQVLLIEPKNAVALINLERANLEAAQQSLSSDVPPPR
jgi:tetratricopeptide (TPR) repeat protein